MPYERQAHTGEGRRLVTVTIGLTVLGWHLGAVTVHLDLDAGAGEPLVVVAPRALDKVSDYFAARWMRRRMAA